MRFQQCLRLSEVPIPRPRVWWWWYLVVLIVDYKDHKSGHARRLVVARVTQNAEVYVRNIFCIMRKEPGFLIRELKLHLLEYTTEILL